MRDEALDDRADFAHHQLAPSMGKKALLTAISLFFP